MPYKNRICPRTQNIQNTLMLLGVVLMFVSVGCQTSTWSSKNITGETDELIKPAASVGDGTPNLTVPTPDSAAAGNPATPQQQAATPQQIMADVRELGATNPAAQAALMQELEKADPDIWPSVVQNFRSRLAYGDRLNKEEMLAARTHHPHADQNPQYVNRNPYYANQPIPTNANQQAAYPPQTQPSQYANPNQYQNQNPYLQQSVPPQNQLPTGNPAPNQVPQNYSTPLPLPGSSQQPLPGYPHTSSKPTNSGVVQASYEEVIDEVASDGEEASLKDEIERVAKEPAVDEVDWNASLTASIESLQKKLASAQAEDVGDDADTLPTSDETKSDQLRLRFMLLAAGRSTEAVEPISGESEAMTDFWAGQLFGLSTLLDERKGSDTALRNASAKRKLTEAINHLGKAASLEVRNLSFCKAVNGFASIEQFEKYEFKPGEQVILYAELDNLKHEETANGYQSALEIGYQIFDSADRRIENQQANTSEECSPVLRQDYYVSQLIRLPERLYPGHHLLKLTVEDKLGKKYGESVIEFDVK